MGRLWPRRGLPRLIVRCATNLKQQGKTASSEAVFLVLCEFYVCPSQVLGAKSTCSARFWNVREAQDWVHWVKVGEWLNGQV